MSSAGYITDEPWQHTYHYSLCPGYLRFASAMAGLTPPRIENYCELAFGQGISLAIHAACHQDTRFVGTDFNPGHVAFAKRLANAAGLANLSLYDSSLEDFARREGIRQQDFVGLSGTWSWLPPPGRSAVTGFLGRRLSPGGLFALHVSTLPGQNAIVGLVHILRAFAPAGASTAQIPAALEGALGFLELSPAFGDLHWHLREMVRDMRTRPTNHLAHEYFNHNWRPDYFCDLAQELSHAGLSWASHGKLLEAVECLHLTPSQIEFLAGIADATKRQLLRDFIRNSGGRTDLWSKGALPRSDRRELMSKIELVLVKPAKEFDFKAGGGLGEVALSKALYGSILEALADHVPVTLAAIAKRVEGRFTFDEVIDAVAILIEKHLIQIVNSSTGEVERSRGRAWALNGFILDLAREGDTAGHLCSPLTGGGIEAKLQQRLFLAAYRDGAMDRAAMAKYASTVLSKLPESPSDADRPRRDRTLLERDAEIFLAEDLPVYRSLQILERV